MLLVFKVSCRAVFWQFLFPSIFGHISIHGHGIFTFCCLATIYACICLRINKTNPGTGPSRCYYCQKMPKKGPKNIRNLLYLKLKTNSTFLSLSSPKIFAVDSEAHVHEISSYAVKRKILCLPMKMSKTDQKWSKTRSLWNFVNQ